VIEKLDVIEELDVIQCDRAFFPTDYGSFLTNDRALLTNNSVL